MKRHIHILFLAFVMAACTSPVETHHGASHDSRRLETHHGASLPDNMMHQRIAAIDSLMWQQPDSALMVLVDFAASPQADSLDAFDGHYCQLLVSELLYKNDCEQTNRAELLVAVDYFDSLCVTETAGRDAACHVSTHNDDIAFLTARTHYINGVGFYEQVEVVNACEEYLKAVEIMESHYKTENLANKKAHFMGLTFNRLFDLFSGQYMSEPAIGCAQQALAFFHIALFSAYSVPITLYKIGVEYAALEEIDSAEYYYAQALTLLPDTNNLCYRNLRSSMALNNYLYHEQTDSALQMLKRMAAEADDEDERLTRYHTIGYIYYRESVYDSALRYLQPVFDRKTDLGIKLQTADHLSEIYGGLGEHEKEEAYIRFMARYKSIGVDDKSETSKLSTLYQGYANRKQQRQAEAEQELAQKIAAKRTLAVAVSVALLVLAVLVWVLRKRSKKRLAASEQELEAERQTHRMEQAAMSGRLKRSNQELRELKEQMKQQNDSAAKTEAAASFAEEPICRLIVERVKDGQFLSQMDCKLYKDYALDKQQLMDLRMAADRHFNQFTVRLKQAYPKLTNSDLDYCCLYLLGLSDADVSALMQKAYPTISQRSRKIKSILGSDSTLPITLRDFSKCNL